MGHSAPKLLRAGLKSRLPRQESHEWKDPGDRLARGPEVADDTGGVVSRFGEIEGQMSSALASRPRAPVIEQAPQTGG